MFRAYFFISQGYESPEASCTFDSSFDDPRPVALAKGAFENEAGPQNMLLYKAPFGI